MQQPVLGQIQVVIADGLLLATRIECDLADQVIFGSAIKKDRSTIREGNSPKWKNYYTLA